MKPDCKITKITNCFTKNSQNEIKKESYHRQINLAQGKFGENIQSLLKIFPREQVLVVHLEQQKSKPFETYNKILFWLGLAPFSDFSSSPSSAQSSQPSTVLFHINKRAKSSKTKSVADYPLENLSVALRRKLEIFYEADQKLLRKLVAEELPFSIMPPGQEETSRTRANQCAPQISSSNPIKTIRTQMQQDQWTYGSICSKLNPPEICRDEGDFACEGFVALLSDFGARSCEDYCERSGLVCRRALLLNQTTGVCPVVFLGFEEEMCSVESGGPVVCRCVGS